MINSTCIMDKKTGKIACPLQNVEARVMIDQSLAEVSLTQNFINNNKTNIEAIYIFPLSYGAEVTGFRA